MYSRMVTTYTLRQAEAAQKVAELAVAAAVEVRVGAGKDVWNTNFRGA